ncbi:MAG: acyl-CoA thioesterase [Novosphingobium sp.]
MPADTNAEGDIFGGWLMSLMDMGAGLIAQRRTRSRVVTVAMDGMQFLLPVKVGDEVSVYGRVTKVGRTSLAIETEAWRRYRHEEEAVRVTAATFTFVAVDDAGKPRVLEQE